MDFACRHILFDCNTCCSIVGGILGWFCFGSLVVLCLLFGWFC